MRVSYISTCGSVQRRSVGTPCVVQNLTTSSVLAEFAVVDGSSDFSFFFFLVFVAF